MKKVITVLTLSICTIFLCSGCKILKSKQQPKETQPVMETIPETIQQVEQVSEVNNIDLSNFDFSDLQTEEEAEVEDFSHLEFADVENAFEISNIAIKNTRRDNMVIVTVEARGSLEGLTGVFLVQLPASIDWQEGDRAWVKYKHAYNVDTDENIVSDIQFIQKAEGNEVKRTVKKEIKFELNENVIPIIYTSTEEITEPEEGKIYLIGENDTVNEAYLYEKKKFKLQDNLSGICSNTDIVIQDRLKVILEDIKIQEFQSTNTIQEETTTTIK